MTIHSPDMKCALSSPFWAKNKSKWDLEDEEREGNLTNDPEARYFVGRTADIVYNYSAKHSYKKDTRRWILDNILLTKIPNTFRSR